MFGGSQWGKKKDGFVGVVRQQTGLYVTTVSLVGL
jgi:hypothetical protein